MKLERCPGDLEVEIRLGFKLLDETLADVAVGSYVVGEDLHSHLYAPLIRRLRDATMRRLSPSEALPAPYEKEARVGCREAEGLLAQRVEEGGRVVALRGQYQGLVAEARKGGAAVEEADLHEP